MGQPSFERHFPRDRSRRRAPSRPIPLLGFSPTFAEARAALTRWIFGLWRSGRLDRVERQRRRWGRAASPPRQAATACPPATGRLDARGLQALLEAEFTSRPSKQVDDWVARTRRLAS